MLCHQSVICVILPIRHLNLSLKFDDATEYCRPVCVPLAERCRKFYAIIRAVGGECHWCAAE